MRPVKIPDSFPVVIGKGNSRCTIYRSENGGYVDYRLAYYLGGKRKREAFADYPRAKARAEEINQDVADGNLESIALSREEVVIFKRAADRLAGRDLDVVVREYTDATDLLGKVPLLDAVRDYVKRHPVGQKKITVAALRDQLLSEKKSDGASDVYLKDVRFRLAAFTKAFQVNVDTLNADTINAFLRSLNAKGRNRNNYRRTIVTFLQFAIDKSFIPADHVPFDKIALAKEEKFRVDIFTKKEIVTLLNAAQLDPQNLPKGYPWRYAVDQGLLPLLVLSAFAGMRTSGEIRRQKWSDINLETGYIRVTDAKGGTAADRLIPISGNLRQWLAICKRTDDFCCSYARPEDALKRLAERAGVPWKHNALRHSYGSYRTAQTENVAQTALEMGNSPRMVMKHYRAVVTKAQGEEWFAITPPGAQSNVIPLAGAA